MLWQRILSAVVGIPLLLWLAYIGGAAWIAAVGIIILVGILEYINMIRMKGYFLSPILGCLGAVLAVFAVYRPDYLDPVVFLIIFAHVFAMVFFAEQVQDTALSFLGIFYVAWMLGHLVLIRLSFPQGFNLVLLSFIITWSTDTGAYFTGRIFGRNKLSPRLSPKKTVEGAVGGVVVCLIAVYILGYFIKPASMASLLWLAAAGSIIGQMGDLAESAVKRWAGVKDSGNIIPGHGGVLDRFDSLILVAPLVYYYSVTFIIF